MGGEDKSRLTRLLLVSTLVAGGYLAYIYMTGDLSEGPQTEETTPGQTVEESVDRETEAAEDEPAEAAEDELAEGDRDRGDDGEVGEAAPAGDEAETRGGVVLPVEPAQRISPEERAERERNPTIETADFLVTLTNLNTAVKSVVLKRERYRDEDGEQMDVVTTSREEYYPMRLELRGVEVPEDALWEVEQLSERAVRFTWEGDGVRVTRKVEAGSGPYQLWSTVRIDNLGGEPREVRINYTAHHYVRRDDEGGGFMFAVRSPNLSHGLCFVGEEAIRVDRELGLEATPGALDRGEPRHGAGPQVLFAGTENTYFANVFAPAEGTAQRCQMTTSDRGGTAEEPDGSLFETRMMYAPEEIAGRGTTETRTLIYMGPKDNDALLAAGHHLSETVDLGWFSLVATYFVVALRHIHGWVGNWGLAIILMTVFVRIVLFPLTWKSFQSMARLRVLKPEMTRINELYKDDAQKKGAAMMELYRKEKVSPLGGCLPSLLQMPVWFAFYASLSTNVELYHAGFALWWTDLSSPDPYYVLPLTLGGLMFLQQKITPTTMDPQQAKIMMYFMPIMITSLMLFLPAGLCLYMVTNSMLGISQQQWIHRSLDKKDKIRRAAEAEEKEAEDRAAAEEAAKAAESSSKSSVVSRTKIRPKSKSKKAAKRRSRRARS